MSVYQIVKLRHDRRLTAGQPHSSAAGGASRMRDHRRARTLCQPDSARTELYVQYSTRAGAQANAEQTLVGVCRL